MSMELILQLLQTASIVLAVVVAMGTIRGRDNDRTAALTKMQVDIDYIKQRLDAFDRQLVKNADMEAVCKAMNKRMDDHLWFEHGRKREDDRE